MANLDLTPVAQYVRMSTDEQKYSIENQKLYIAEYARVKGYDVIHSYEDPGESGLQLKHREGLRHLLSDVVTNKANYKKILVLDVSRWGRFQDADEAAHYEFVCKQAGIKVIYCAEQFTNDGTAADYFAKVLKRAAAAEYSRELSIRNFENHKRYVERGFRVGSQPGYGFRRMALSSDGTPKGVLGTGQYKMLISDRVTLVHGPQHEIDCIRLIFHYCLKNFSASRIAKELNRKGSTRDGATWRPWMITKILANPKYAGTYMWNRRTERLHSPSRKNDPDQWIVKRNAFPAIVSQAIFNKAQTCLHRSNVWTDEELLATLTKLLKKKGYISERLIQATNGTPSLATYHRRLGTFEKLYSLVKFNASPNVFVRTHSRQATLTLRAGLFRQLEALFPGRTAVFHLPHKTRQIMKLDNTPISILLARYRKRPQRRQSWYLLPVPCESAYVTLVCRLSTLNDGFHSFYLFPMIDKTKPMNLTSQHHWLLRGERLQSLEELPKALARLALKA